MSRQGFVVKKVPASKAVKNVFIARGVQRREAMGGDSKKLEKAQAGQQERERMLALTIVLSGYEGICVRKGWWVKRMAECEE